MHDVVVIGAGINGLTSAAYLARAGKRVLVVEANDKAGGYVRSDPNPNAPGFKMNTYAIEFPFVHIKPSVVRELGLGRFGLQFVNVDPMNGYLSPRGTSWLQYQSLDRTCASIAKLSKRDAQTWRKLMESLTALLEVGLPYLSGHPTRPNPGALVEMALHAAKHRKALVPATRYLLQSPMEIIDQFETEEMRAWIALNVAAGSFRPLDEIANTSILVYFAFNHKYGILRPVGGSGAFIDALIASIQSDGGEVRTSAPVERITVAGGRATGVTLQSGEEIRAGQVVATTDPTSLFTKLLDPSDVSSTIAEEVSQMKVLSANVSHITANVAVDRAPDFSRHGIGYQDLGGLSFAPDVPYVNRLLDNIMNGVLGEEQPFYIATPSISDRSYVPEGSKGENVWFWVGAVPLRMASGEEWKDVKPRHFDHILDKVESYCPGFKDSIVGMDVLGPEDFNNEWVFKGSSRSVDLIPSQMGPWRPSPSLAGYETPGIDGLWRSGHGTHPMSGTSAWPGRLTAQTMLKQERRNRLLRRSAG